MKQIYSILLLTSQAQKNHSGPFHSSSQQKYYRCCATKANKNTIDAGAHLLNSSFSSTPFSTVSHGKWIY